MKRHVKYILFFILMIVIMIVTGIGLLTNQFFKFYDSYMNEENEEINHQIILVEWVIKPILAENNLAKLEQFCNDLKDDDIAIFVQDSDGKLLGTSRPDIDINKTRVKIYDRKLLKSYKRTIKNKMIAQEKNIVVNGKTYTLRIALLQDDMIMTFLRNQHSIILVFVLGILAIIAISLYVMFYLKLPFDKLQESATKITNGDLDTEIFVIEKGMLSEHSKTINNMSKQLKQKIEKLEYIETSKNEMLCGFSHEVKTPLTSLLLASELLNTDKNSTDECIKIIKTNAERLNNLILSIIDIANLEYESLNKHNHFATFMLENCIFEAINNTKVLATNMPINFDPQDSVQIYADSQLLETAITNILVNAIKYSKSDKIDITMSQDDKNAIIKIRDYGIGIPAEHLPKIFDNFYRVDKNRSRELGGSGLGLSIVKQIVDHHKGTITLKSDGGCEFTITLPL